MRELLTPPRRRGVEFLDSPDIDPRIVTRSLAGVIGPIPVITTLRLLTLMPQLQLYA